MMTGVDPPLVTRRSLVSLVSPVVWLGMITGCVGVASGFAIFFLTLDDDSPLQLVVILLTATLLSLVVEYLRELIDTTPEEHRAHRSRSSKLVVSLLIVALAELFALGWHAVIASWGTRKFDAAARIVMGGALSSSHATATMLTFLVLVWMVSGVALAAALARGIGTSTRPLGQRIASGAGRGVVVGALVAPAILCVVIVGGFALEGVRLLLREPDTWRHNFHVVQEAVGSIGGAPGAFLHLVFLAADKVLSVLGDGNRWAPLIVVVTLVGGGIAALRKDVNWLGVALLAIGAGLVMSPLLPGLGRMALVLVRTAVIWALPGAVLGALVPLLERPAALHRWWSLVAFVAAVVLIVLTAARLDGRWWLIAPALGIIATGAFIWRTGRVDVCWPVLAICVATIVCGLVIALQQFATFAGVLGTLYDLRSMPSRISSLRTVNSTQAESLDTVISDLSKALARQLPANLNTLEWALPATSPEAAAARGREQTRVASNQLASLPESTRTFVPHGAEWQRSFEEITGKTADCLRRDEHEGTQGFGGRLSDIVCTQGRLAEVDAGARQELKVSRELASAIDKARQPVDTLSVRQWVSAGPAGLEDWQIAEAEVWRRSQALLEPLRTNERTLEAVLGEPVNGQPASGLTAFKASFDVEATEAYATVSRYLELGLAGSFGFWSTLGLLAGWARYRQT